MKPDNCLVFLSLKKASSGACWCNDFLGLSFLRMLIIVSHVDTRYFGFYHSFVSGTDMLFCLLSYACHFPLDPYYFDRNVLLRDFYILLIQNKLLMTLHFEV